MALGLLMILVVTTVIHGTSGMNYITKCLDYR